MTKKHVAFRLSENCNRALRADQHLVTTSKVGSLEGLLAIGMKQTMLDVGIDPHFIHTGRGNEAVFEMYRKFVEAELLFTGKSNDRTYRKEQPPRIGFWADNNITGYAILHTSQNFTPNGIEILSELITTAERTVDS